MRIVTYNLLNGGAGNQHWSHVIEAFDPDLFLAQESYPPERCGLQQHLRAQTVWRAANNSWGTAVYAKWGTVRELEIEKFRGWLVGVELEGFPHPGVAGRRLRVFSLHAPPKSVTGDEYPETVKKMLDVIGENRGDADLIIGGDFNLLSLGMRHHSERRNDGTPWTTTQEELDIQQRLREEFGLINCWQTANPGVPLAQTLRWSGEVRPKDCPKCPPVCSFHCDGIFLPSSWPGRVFCTVVNNEEWTGRNDVRRSRSDYNPVVATFVG